MTKETSKILAKACPFCGDSLSLELLVYFGQCQMNCNTCGSCGPVIADDDMGPAERARAAVEDWNGSMSTGQRPAVFEVKIDE